jgi:hypothetical protein
VRKTIRRSIIVTATAACALGFGFFSASASTVPTLPAVPELPLSSLTSVTDLGQGVTGAETLPALPAEETRALPVGDALKMPGGNVLNGELTKLLSGAGGLDKVTGITKQLGVNDLSSFTGQLGLRR